MICSSLNRLLRIVRPLRDGLSFHMREPKGSRSLPRQQFLRDRPAK